MHPLSIIIAVGFLGMLLVIGGQFSVLSSRQLLRAYTSELGLQAQGGRKGLRVAINSMLLAVGLFLLYQGGMGLYRLFWIG